MNNVKKWVRLGFAALLLGGIGAASAQPNITIGSGNVVSATGGNVAISIDFNPNGIVVAGYNTVIDYDNSILSADPTSSNGICTIDNVLHTISLIRATFPPAAIPAENICVVTFPVAAGATVGTYPLAHHPGFPSTSFVDLAGTEIAPPGTVTDGAINVIAAPPDVVLTFSPNYGTGIAFAGGTVGTNQTANISVSNTGSVGTGTVDNCTFGGANPGAFSVTSGIPATVPPNATIALQATLAATPLSATLTCRVTDTAAGSPNMRTWNLSAPAGAAPGYSSVPAPGSLMSQTGVPGTTLTYTVVITNTGNPGPGSDMTYTCSVAGPDFAITSGASGGPLAVGSSDTVTIQVTAPADGVTVNDVMTCTSSELPNLLAEYDLEATGMARVAPTFVPASSLWSKLALFGIFAALGMLIIGLRRSH